MKAILTDRDYEALSAYMDGQLSPGERRKLEERMQTRPDLRIALEDMRRMRTLLRQAPRRRAPRNFTLTPAMVGEPKRRPFQWTNLFPALSFTSALAALALVVIVTLQLGYNPQQAPQTVAMQPPAASEEVGVFEAPAAEAPSAAQPEMQTREMPAGEAAPAEPAQEEAFSAKGAGTPEALSTPEQEPGIMAAGEAEPTQPVIINWNGVPGAPIGGGSNVIADGRGGGGPEMGGMGGGLGGGPSGGIAPGGVYLPPESVELMVEDPAANSPTQTPAAGAPAAPSTLSGTGPILGVPAAEDGGEIIDRQAITGQAAPTEAPAEMTEQSAPSDPAPTDLAAAPAGDTAATAVPEIARVDEPLESADQNQPQAAPQPGPAVEQAQPEPLLGMAPRTLLLVEIVLGAITLAAGGLAFLLWKQRTGR